MLFLLFYCYSINHVLFYSFAIFQISDSLLLKNVEESFTVFESFHLEILSSILYRKIKVSPSKLNSKQIITCQVTSFA